MEKTEIEEEGTKEEATVTDCVTCKKTVKVKLIPYGNGHIASCPECGKLAYNGK